MAAVLVAPQPASAAAQLVSNGTFAVGVSGWNQIGQTTVTPEAERMKVAVNAKVANPWDAMVATVTTATLNPGKNYTLSFDAYSTVAGYPMTTTVQYRKTPGTNQSLNKQLALTTAGKRHTFSFVAQAPVDTLDKTVEVTFQLGNPNAVSTVRFDNVSLMETQSTRPTALYVDNRSNPATWVAEHPQDSRAQAINSSIAGKPIFKWFGGWFSDITAEVDTYVGAAQAADKLPMLVAYNIPNRDVCAGYSGGGAGNAAAYHSWITEFAKAIGTRHAIVILEPDGIATAECVKDENGGAAGQYAMLADATQVLKSLAPNTWVYLDAGNATWRTVQYTVDGLKAAGVGNARGFSLNVSNFITTADSEAYAVQVKNALAPTHGTKTYVIDTGRNGNGPYTGTPIQDPWCNPPGRKLGTPPVKQSTGAEYLFWVKVPGDSDGTCRGGTIPAGQFSPDFAMNLING